MERPTRGGRRHRGIDMMAAFDESVYAIEAGVVSVVNRGISGKQIFFRADSGRSYHYAHLNRSTTPTERFNISDGGRCQPGGADRFRQELGQSRGNLPSGRPPHLPQGVPGRRHQSL